MTTSSINIKKCFLPVAILSAALVLFFLPTPASAVAHGDLTITAPRENAQVSGSVTFSATTNNVAQNSELYWAVRKGTCDVNSSATVAGNVSSFTNQYTWNNGKFNATVNMSTLPRGAYCLVVNIPRHELRETRTFQLVTNGSTDTDAPIATIVSPNDGATVSGTVILRGTVVDTDPKTSYFRIEGPRNYVRTSLYNDGRTTHEYSWNTTRLADGEYTIYFEARDKAGNKDGTRVNPGDSVDVVKVTVRNTTSTPPDSKLSNFRQCMKGGWSNWDFRNQGQCIRYMMTGKDSR
jgi:hypothetical protein